jgi:iron complex outermembrane recepter protein
MEKPMIKDVPNRFGFVRIVLVAGVGCPLIFASNAFAQAPTTIAPPVGEAVAERVIVTGSNIPTAQEETSLPVTTYTTEFLLKAGAGTPVEGLRQLPSFVGNARTENDSNNGTGSASINLRGLGAENVVVLINGRRAILSFSAKLGEFAEASDINFIPISGLQRVEVLKDGASSIYGSDAVAGVVDFIMYGDRRLPPYEGAEFEARYGTTTDRDANERQAWIRGGVTGLEGKVAIFASAEYYNRAAIFSVDRTIAATGDRFTSDIGTNPDIGVAGLGLSGTNMNSPTFAGRVSVVANAPGLQQFPVTGQLVLTDLSNANVTPASYRPFEQAPGSGSTDPSRFNFRAFTPAIPAIEKSIEYVSGRYKVFDDALVVYGDMLYSHYRQSNALAGSPFAWTTGTPVQLAQAQASIFNPFGDRLDEVRYRLQQELGNRTDVFDKDLWRWVIGAKGDFEFADNAFISHLGYDTGITYERFDNIETDGGDAQSSLLGDQTALNVFNPFIGQNAPPIGVAPTYVTLPSGERVPTGATAPYNNVAGAEAAAYLGHSLYHQKDFLADVTLNAHLFPNLWNGGIDVASGYQHWWEQQHSIPDPVQAAGDQLGFDAKPNFKYHQEVGAAFAEIRVPFVISTMNVPLVYNFEVDYAFRYERFHDKDLTNPGPHESATFNNNGNSRVTVRWQPIPDLLLRGTWGESFRSPTPDNLFSPVFQTFPQVFDPVTGDTFQPVNGVLIGGNPDLKPEKTQTWTAGLVYTPKFVPGFTISADWYQIFSRNLIISGDDFAQLLLTTDPFNPLITRNSSGNVTQIQSLFNNAGKRFVQGVDITAVYQLPTTNFGQFTFTLGYNHFFTWKAEPVAGLGTHNFLGTFNNGTFPLAPGAIPFNKGFLRFEWEYKLGPGILDFVAQGNYIGDYEDDPFAIVPQELVASDPGTDIQPNFVFHRRVTDWTSLDLQASYEFVKPPMEAPAPGYSKEGKDFKSPLGKQPVTPGVVETGSFWQRMLWGTKVTAGVVNAFDRMPPTVLGAFNDNYDTSLYSIRNRFWYVALSKKF